MVFTAALIYRQVSATRTSEMTDVLIYRQVSATRTEGNDWCSDLAGGPTPINFPITSNNRGLQEGFMPADIQTTPDPFLPYQEVVDRRLLMVVDCLPHGA